jgi:putative restriction endonuclease
MRPYVVVTDDNWFQFLASEPREEVNFWSPSGKVTFRAFSSNELFLFKLHSPRNFIVGSGFFVSHSKLPLSLAWRAFGQNNGAPDEITVARRVQKYRKTDESDPTIGCNILASPFFFERQDWILAPESFKLNTIQSKVYSTF